MGWFKTEEELEKINLVDFQVRKTMMPRRVVSRIEEEGEFVTIRVNASTLPVVSFTEIEDEELEPQEEQDVSTIHSSNIS